MCFCGPLSLTTPGKNNDHSFIAYHWNLCGSTVSELQEMYQNVKCINKPFSNMRFVTDQRKHCIPHLYSIPFGLLQVPSNGAPLVGGGGTLLHKMETKGCLSTIMKYMSHQWQIMLTNSILLNAQQVVQTWRYLVWRTFMYILMNLHKQIDLVLNWFEMFAKEVLTMKFF